jgi:hypothetical protein
MLGTAGLALTGAGGLGLAVLMAGGWLGWNLGWIVAPAILAGAVLVIGVQLIGLGLLAELVTSYNLDGSETYSIAETIGE